MTLILAITCKDGIVFASDGQATRVIDEKATTSKAIKIYRLGKNALWGCAGIETCVSRFWSFLRDTVDETKDCSFDDIQLRANLKEVADNTKNEANYRSRTFNVAKRCSEYLVVMHQKFPMIWWMADGCGSTFFGKDEQELTKCCMFSIGDGSGQIVAQALFDNLKDKDREFTLAQGSLIVYRLIKEAMNSSPEVGKFVDIWTIKDNAVERKTDDEIEELNNLSDDWIKEERRVSDGILFSLL